MYASRENVFQNLSAAGLLGQQNYYFTTFTSPSMGQYMLLGTFAGVLNEFGGYIINVTERGIGILPLSSRTGKCMLDRAAMLPYQYIARVEAQNGGIGTYKKIQIITMNNECISFRVTKKVLPNPDHLNNVNYFLSIFHAL